MSIIIIVIIIVIIFATTILIKTDKHEVIYVESNLDHNTYLVRDLPDKLQASDLLARLKANMTKLIDILYVNRKTEYKEFESNIDQLKDRMQNVVINESSEDSEYTSYSVNKGEQIVFCLRSKNNGQMHDLNLLMYVALHEMAHVANKTFGHDENFKKIFAFITNVAISNGLYQKINFPNEPVEYCGLTISESIV